VSFSLRQVIARPHGGFVELAGLVALYGVYEGVRGFGDASLQVAQAHTREIVALERDLSLFVERSIQRWVEQVPSLPPLLGGAYMTLHLGATALMLVWVFRRHRERFPLVRTTLVVSTAISLAVYVLYPAAPPRLAGIGFSDTVTESARVNLSSDLLGGLYNPFAAVPSLHFGYALLVGVVVAWLARPRWLRVLGAAYPAAMLFIIVATGNHFLFDAAAGGVVTLVGALVAAGLVRERAPKGRCWQVAHA
jgi:hypothetical protein